MALTDFEDYLQGSGKDIIDQLYGIGTQPFDLFNTPDFKMYYQGAYGTQLLELIDQLENILGYVPNLSDPATLNTLVQNGVLDAQTAQTLGALNAPVNTKVGSLQQEFANRGGMRALEGPYLAKQAEVLKGFQKAVQGASLASIGQAGQFGFTKRGQDIQALMGAGNLGIGHRQVNLGHPEFRGPEGGGGELSPEDLRRLLPPEPYRPETPGFWDRNAGAFIGPGVGLLGELARNYFKGSPPPATGTTGFEPPPYYLAKPGGSYTNYGGIDFSGQSNYNFPISFDQPDYPKLPSDYYSSQQPSYDYSYDVPSEQSYSYNDYGYDYYPDYSSYSGYDYSNYYPDYQYDYTSEYY